MTEQKDILRRLFAGETVSLGKLSAADAERINLALETLCEQSERDWREAGPDTERSTVALYHVRAVDVAAARAHFDVDEDDDPGAELWVEAKAALRAAAVARDDSKRMAHVLIAYIVFDLVGRSPDCIYDPDELRALVAAIAGWPELPGLVAAELAARRTRTEVPPWPADAADAPYAWLVASLQRAADAGLGVLWEVS